MIMLISEIIPYVHLKKINLCLFLLLIACIPFMMITPCIYQL